jgi:uncharacterized peroxidase-related enzyme
MENPLKFDVHTIGTAPEQSRPTLEGVKQAYGFVPNLFGVFAESPAAAEAYAAIGKALQKAGLTAVEQQVVFLSVSTENACKYCVAAHSTVAKGAKMPDEVLTALREQKEIPDAHLQALSAFTRAVMRSGGWVPEDALQAFLDAGFERRNVLDVLTIIAMKTLSNYTNHIAETPLDDAFAGQAW